MGKLGYTWYPKDWGNSDAVFELTLSERGFYRELIDMAMLHDNRIKWNVNLWARKFNATTDEICDISDKLCELELIEFRFFENQDKERDAREWLFIPSCEPRLNLVRGGKNGGKKSKKNKPTPKPTPKPNVKPTPNQKKEKRKEIEITEFWDLYHSISKKLKSDLQPSIKHWDKLTETEKEKAKCNIKAYIDSVNDPKYIVKARTYLADKKFNDEFNPPIPKKMTKERWDTMNEAERVTYFKNSLKNG